VMAFGGRCWNTLRQSWGGLMRRFGRIFLEMVLPAVVCSAAGAADSSSADMKSAPIKALLVTGGGYSDYNTQTKILTEGISARANVSWGILRGQDVPRGAGKPLRLLYTDDWAKGYDVIVYNEGYNSAGDSETVNKILAPHRKGLPAVVLHGTMHSFKGLKTDVWFEFTGMQSPNHGPGQDFKVTNLTADNPIMKGFPPVWDTLKHEELYIVDKMFPNTTVLAEGHDKKTDKAFPAIWTYTYGHAKARVFGTTLAHRSVTMSDPVYLTLVTRGLLWAVDKLDAPHLQPAKQVMLDGSRPETTFHDPLPEMHIHE
jgi:type 1 glutamine amidotransferase